MKHNWRDVTEVSHPADVLLVLTGVMRLFSAFYVPTFFKIGFNLCLRFTLEIYSQIKVIAIVFQGTNAI